MANLAKVTTAQEVYAMELRFKASDYVVNAATGALVKVGDAPVTFDALELPPNAVIVGGSLNVETTGLAAAKGAVQLKASASTAAKFLVSAVALDAATPTATAIVAQAVTAPTNTVQVALTANTGDVSGVYALRILYVVQGRQTVVTN